MENQTLYGYHYIDEENGDHRMTVSQGIFLPGTPENTRRYPVVRHLGNVNLTRRYFLKYKKFPNKIKNVTNNVVTIEENNRELRPIQTILLELGHQQDFIDLIANTITNTSNDVNIRTYRYESSHHIFDTMINELPYLTRFVGKVNF